MLDTVDCDWIILIPGLSNTAHLRCRAAVRALYLCKMLECSFAHFSFRSSCNCMLNYALPHANASQSHDAIVFGRDRFGATTDVSGSYGRHWHHHHLFPPPLQTNARSCWIWR